MSASIATCALCLNEVPAGAGVRGSHHAPSCRLYEAPAKPQDIPSRPSTAVRAAQILLTASETMMERDGRYRGSDALYAKVMAVLFPDLRLQTNHDHHRFHILMLMVVKLTRYVRNWDDGHPDSLTDLINYTGMLAALDAERSATVRAEGEA